MAGANQKKKEEQQLLEGVKNLDEANIKPDKSSAEIEVLECEDLSEGMQSVDIKRRLVKPRRMMELVEGKLCVRDVGEDRRLEGDVKRYRRKEKRKKRRKKAEELKIQEEKRKKKESLEQMRKKTSLKRV